MKKMSVVLGLLLAVLVMGCGIYESYGFDYKQLSSIERGMSFKEVCTILGEPAFRDLNKEGEAWTFRAYTPAGSLLLSEDSFFSFMKLLSREVVTG